MKCSTCDEPLTPGIMFCPNCGARVPTESSAGAATTALPSGYSGTSNPAPQPYTPQPYTPQPYTPPPPNQYGMSASQPYGAAQPGYMPATLPTSTAATVSLVFGILSWVFLPVIAAIVAVVAGHMARNEIRASNGQIGGGGFATAGMILGYVQLGLLLLVCVGIFVLGLIGAAVDR